MLRLKEKHTSQSGGAQVRQVMKSKPYIQTIKNLATVWDHVFMARAHRAVDENSARQRLKGVEIDTPQTAYLNWNDHWF